MLITFGHGTASAERIGSALREAGIAAVVDIRIAPGSRRNPHVARAELEHWLPGQGIGYRWDKRLGGFRRAPADSPDTFWREPAFRGYAWHMRQPDFLAAIDELLGQTAGQAATGQASPHVAIMCSESLWWRCHRRLVADFTTIARRQPVRHLFLSNNSLAGHRPSPGARLTEEGLLIYDGGQASLL